MGLVEELQKAIENIDITIIANEDIKDVEPEIVGEYWDEDEEASCNEDNTKEEEIEAKALSYKERSELPTSSFALVQKKDGKVIRRFPIHDLAHARNALARLPNAKGLTDEERAQVERRAKRAIERIESGQDNVYANNKDENADDVFSENNEEETLPTLREKVNNLVSSLEEKSQEIGAKDKTIDELNNELSELKKKIVDLENSSKEVVSSYDAKIKSLQTENILLKRCMVTGESPDSDNAKIVASMSEDQFNLYVKVNNRSRQEEKPRDQLITENKKATKITLG